jgi:hypothetical protein
MALPKPAFLVVDRLASGPGPPWPLKFTFTWSIAPCLSLGFLRRPHMAAKRTGIARGDAP